MNLILVLEFSMHLEKIMNPILHAAKFAKSAHEGQTRRYSGVPYIIHPARVAARVSLLDGVSEDMIVAAWLHDVIEDTDVIPTEIGMEFGEPVLKLVRELTNPSKDSKEPRWVRKQMDLDHLKDVSRDAKRIKLADRYENLLDMEGAKDDFVALYAKESRALVEAIGLADDVLRVAIKARIVELERADVLPSKSERKHGRRFGDDPDEIQSGGWSSESSPR